MLLYMLIVFIASCLFSAAAGEVATLTANPTTLYGPLCPGNVVMTCSVEDLYHLKWYFNTSPNISYAYSPGEESRLPINISTIPDVLVLIISVTQSTMDNDRFTARSTLTTPLFVLRVLNVQDVYCGSREVRSENIPVNFTILDTPPPDSSATCSLVTSANGLDVSLQWSSSFNSQHAVERYRVSVDPDPSSSCSSDQVVPSEDYSCPGLSPERNYSITVSAINCGDQEGESDTFTVLPQLLAPDPPKNIETVPDFDDNGVPKILTIYWMESDSISGNCYFSGAINYTLILEDSAGEVVEERVVSSDRSCSNESCSSSFSLSNQTCRVSIMANNTFGGSSPASADVVNDRLTTVNIILLALGVTLEVVILCSAIATTIVILVSKRKLKKGSWIVIVVGFVVIVVPVVLWVAVGFQVGLQDNTCESAWQSTRNHFIISTFAFLFLTIAIAIAAMLATCVFGQQKSRRKKKSVRTSNYKISESGEEQDTGRISQQPKYLEVIYPDPCICESINNFRDKSLHASEVNYDADDEIET